jgi:hypothetical protein
MATEALEKEEEGAANEEGVTEEISDPVLREGAAVERV